MTQFMPTRPGVTGIVLAGGRATRMGGTDKGLIELGGRPMIAHVLSALTPQVDQVLINANRNQERYAAFGWPVVPDENTGFIGPLAGLAVGLKMAETPLVVTVPCDSPLLASDLVARLYAASEREDAEIAVPFDGERLQPVFALVKRGLLGSLMAYLDDGGRKIDRWFEVHRVARVDFSDRAETFANVNDPGQQATLESKLAASGPGA
jgi:molybdenum cofactor guanylyltransferase